MAKPITYIIEKTPWRVVVPALLVLWYLFHLKGPTGVSGFRVVLLIACLVWLAFALKGSRSGA